MVQRIEPRSSLTKEFGRPVAHRGEGKSREELPLPAGRRSSHLDLHMTSDIKILIAVTIPAVKYATHAQATRGGGGS